MVALVGGNVQEGTCEAVDGGKKITFRLAMGISDILVLKHKDVSIFSAMMNEIG